MKVIAALLALVATATAFTPAPKMPFTRVVMNNGVSLSHLFFDEVGRSVGRTESAPRPENMA